MPIPILRPFQNELKTNVFDAWNQGAANVIMQLATGGGKTVTLSSITLEHQGFTCIIAHRQELIGQLSLTLARYGIYHRIVGTDSLRRAISRTHVEVLGRSYVDQTAPVIVASIDSLIRADASSWAPMVTLWIVDEGHHVVLDNKWHRGIAQFTNPNCRGLLPTATPICADGKGLGRPTLGGSGVADIMVQGAPMRWLIEEGFLSHYRIIAPTSDLEVLGDVGASGDWSSAQLKEAAKRSHIVGDLVKGYLTYGEGRQGISFCTDVETAAATAQAYRDAGVAAECLTGETDDFVRRAMIAKFERKELQQITAVDIISEGFDLPAIKVISEGRPTASYANFAQRFGRMLRIDPSDPAPALYIDHVANTIRHKGPPDKVRQFPLANRDKRSKVKDELPWRRCIECLTPYEASWPACPACGYKPVPATRNSPAAVEGDMAEMSPELLESLRKSIDEVDELPQVVRSRHAMHGWSQMVSNVQVNNHVKRKSAQERLRAAMAIWAGPLRAGGHDDSRLQRTFYHLFGTSVPEAMTLPAGDAEALTIKVEMKYRAK